MPLLARPTAGGEDAQRTILRASTSGNYAVGPRGIFHVSAAVPRPGSRSLRVLRHWDAATGQDRPSRRSRRRIISGLGVSPDGRTILYGHSSWGRADLMMIENFR